MAKANREVPTGRFELSNVRSDRVRFLRNLNRSTGRARAGRFLIEGPQAVRAALTARPARVRLRELLLTEAVWREHEAELAALEVTAVQCTVITEEVLAQLSDTVRPQGWLAVADLLDTSAEQVLAADTPASQLRYAILAQVRDPGNAGTVLRAADATGASGVFLTNGSVDVHNSKCVRATAGSLFQLPVASNIELPELLDQLRNRGVRVLAAAGSGTEDLDQLLDQAAESGTGLLTGPTAWLFGNEAWGLPEPVQHMVDATVRVPMQGSAESLNLAMAATICLHASARAQTGSARRAARSAASTG